MIDRNKENSFEIEEPFLIQRILSLLKIDDKVNHKPTPFFRPLFRKDQNADSRVKKSNYRAAIDMLNYLLLSTRPDISMDVQQCARYCIDPKVTHERAVMRIGEFLLGNRDKGLNLTPDKSKEIECYVDADFAGSWYRADAIYHENVLSRTGYMIFYYECPVIWCSKLHIKIALSTAEVEYIALSQATWKIIPLMNSLKENKPCIKLDI